jgi:SAM-dependent methyltransferase
MTALLKTNKWTVENSFDKKCGSTSPPQWPHEILVKIFSSKAYSNLLQNIIPLNESMKVLEIGCMGGNNLRFFGEKGCAIFGIEVTQELVRLANLRCSQFGIKNPEIVCGNNQFIPFGDESMDVLISVNTLHYDHGIKNINKSVESFANVLKPGGVAFIETVAPEHFIYKRATKIEDLCFRSNYEDFRKNDLFGFFESPIQFKEVLENYFSEVEIVTLSEHYQDVSLQFFVGLARK